MSTSASTQQIDPDRLLGTDHLQADLVGRTARGAAVTLGSQAFKFFAGLAGTAVLARLLTPGDYGLIGMVAVVIGFIAMFKDLGLSAASVQRPDLTVSQVSTLFWINVGLGSGITLVTIVIAPVVGWFYGEPRLTPITVVSALGFLLGGLLVQHEALLQRQMRFTALATIDIISMLCGYAVAIGLASRNAGYWALVFSQLAQASARTIGVWMMASWRPGLPARSDGVRSMLRFGGNLTGFSTINYFARNLDNLLIGRFWGPHQLGLYSRAYQLLLLPIDQINAPITTVAVPALSRLAHSPERFRRAYLRLVEKVAIVTMPLMTLMIATSDWVVALVLGPAWREVGLIFALLGIVGLVQPVANTVGWLFIAQGRTRDMFHWGLLGGTITILAILLGLPWGGVGVAASYSLCSLFLVIPLLFWFAGRPGPVRTTDFYRMLILPALTSGCVVLALLVLRTCLPVWNPFLSLAAASGVTIGVIVLVLPLSQSGRAALRDILLALSFLASHHAVTGRR